MVTAHACTTPTVSVWLGAYTRHGQAASAALSAIPLQPGPYHRLWQAAGPSELSVVLCSDEHIARLNSEWRQKAEATDVLSFPMEQDTGDGCPVRMLGDLIISLDTAQRQADERRWVQALQHAVVHDRPALSGLQDSDREWAEAL